MALANSPIQAHKAEADSDILIGVGRNELTSGVNTTDDADSVTAAGMSRLAFSIKQVFRILLASAGMEERKPPDELVLSPPLDSDRDASAIFVRFRKAKVSDTGLTILYGSKGEDTEKFRLCTGLRLSRALLIVTLKALILIL